MGLRFARALCLVGLILFGFGATRAADAAQGQAPMTAEDINRELGFMVLGNHVFTFLHELGHALISQLDLPVVGQEEDAVDEFATIALIAFARDEHTEPDEREIFYQFALAGARAFMKLWFELDKQIGGKTESLPFWDEHGLDLKRTTNILCLLYGSDPQRFKEIADGLGMPEDRRQRCIRDFTARDAAWTRLLTPHLIPATGEPANNGKMTVQYGTAGSPESQTLEATLRQVAVFEGFATIVNLLFVLPNDIRVVNRDCGEANAFWNPRDRSITMCYELMRLVGKLFAADMQPPAKPVPPPPPVVDQGVQFFAAEAGKPVGPMSLDLLKQRVQAGLTKRTDLVWKAGTPAWVPADQLPELKGLFP